MKTYQCACSLRMPLSHRTSMASSSCSATASPCASGISDDFAAWIVENGGGDDDLVGRLKSNGFNSKLSLTCPPRMPPRL